MGNSWKTLNIGDLISSAKNALVGGPFGSNLVSKDYVPFGIPVIRGQNMGKRWVSGDFVFVSDKKAKELEANTGIPTDLVFTQRGTLGQVSLIPEGKYSKYVISQSQMKISLNKEIAEPQFLYYVFTSEEQKQYIQMNAIQSGVPHTNLGILRETPVYLPPSPSKKP